MKCRNKWNKGKKAIEKVIETKSRFFEKIINKTDKPLGRLTEKRKRTQKNKRRHHNWYHTNSKGLWETATNNYSQQIGQPWRNGKIPRNIQSSQTEFMKK